MLINLVLFQITNFHTKLKTQEVKELISESEVQLNHGHGEEEASVDLKIPSVPPSRLEYCKIIDTDYKVVVEACVESWYHKNLKTTADVIIGSVPLLCHELPVPAFPLSRAPPTLHSEYRPLGDQPPPQVGPQPYCELYGGEVRKFFHFFNYSFSVFCRVVKKHFHQRYTVIINIALPIPSFFFSFSFLLRVQRRTH